MNILGRAFDILKTFVCDQIELLNLVLKCIDLNRWLVFGRLSSGVRVVRDMMTLYAVI